MSITEIGNTVVGASSSNMNSNYLRSKYIKNLKISDGRGDYICPDFFNPDYVNAIRSLNTVKAIDQYDESMRIPVLASKQCESSSAWWLLMAKNGFVHPLRIDSGTLIRYPDVEILQTAAASGNAVRNVATKAI